jgi:cellulose synthase operon protein C
LAHRAAAVHRSLAYADSILTEVAAGIERNIAAYRPADRAQQALVGDIWADRERYDQAKPYWDHMAAIEPGRPEAYLDAATVFWDYYLFDDTLRLLAEGRSRLGRPALYAYETGAVYENKREYARAIEEYLRGALAPEPVTQARSRLLQLARRPARRSAIDEATAKLVSGANPSAAAVSLRVAVLEAQQRAGDLEQFLLGVTSATTSLELLDRAGEIAAFQVLDGVRARVIERQIELITDPVERMRLTLTLMRSHESRGDLAPAERLVENLYREHPRVLGVVRAVADYHWRHDNRDRSLEVLRAAASASHPDLGKQFTFEVARKATDAGRYELARQSLETLLEADPFRPDYLAAMAETFGRERRYDALRDFYQSKLTEIRDATLPADVKRERTATLRRGLIPALTELGETSSAVDQYIEIINRFPEDDQLAREATLYSSRHGRRQQLLDAYLRTTAESPKDYRYHRVLAWIRTELEDYPAAIEAYRRAAQVRPDHVGLLESRAALEERLLRFDDALATSQEIHKLTYENPQWMEKIAEMHARQGRRRETVEAIEKAFIAGRPERAEHYFAAAGRLEEWNLLAEAQPFAEKGVELAGEYLFRDGTYFSGARSYARLLTRLRQYAPAYRRLGDAWRAVGRDVWAGSFHAALLEIGAAAERYFTPEEKAVFASFLEQERQRASAQDAEQLLIPIAQRAGLAELEADWRYARMMLLAGSDNANGHRRRLIELQGLRLRHDELGRQLEAYWDIYPRQPERDGILHEAAEAYRAAGNEDGEFRVLNRYGQYQERFFELLARREPQRLVALATPRSPTDEPDQPAGYAVLGGGFELALDAVKARGRNLPPVWTRAYTGLVGLYHARQTPEVDAAFEQAVATATIGERLGTTVNRDEQLAGDLWFYYGARYGEYLANFQRPQAADYLPATVEHAPGRASAYLDLADWYRDRRDFDNSLAEYGRVLQLDPEDASVHNRMALILWDRQQRDQALEHWRAALEILTQHVDRRTLPPSFWDDAPELFRNFGARGVTGTLREPIENLLPLYVQRNGAYRAGPLLESFVGAFGGASGDRAAATSSVLSFADQAPNPVEYLSSLVDVSWISGASRDVVFQRLLEAARQQVERADARAKYYAQQTLDNWTIRWIAFLLETGRGPQAQEAFGRLPASAQAILQNEQAALLLRLAAQAGRLEAQLERFQQRQEPMPELPAFREAAAALQGAGQHRGGQPAAGVFLHLPNRESRTDPSKLSRARRAALRRRADRRRPRAAAAHGPVGSAAFCRAHGCRRAACQVGPARGSNGVLAPARAGRSLGRRLQSKTGARRDSRRWRRLASSHAAERRGVGG